MASPVETWLWLLLVMQPYNTKTIYALSQCGGDAKAAAKKILGGEFDFLTDAEKNRAKNTHVSDVKQITDICGKNDIQIVTLDSEDYPPMLKAIKNPPIVLFVKGNLASLNNLPAVAAVGTRNPDEYSVRAADYICRPLAQLGFVIVSGMAVGLDAAAHKACLKGGGKTIGVLGCGILVDYPPENRALKEEVLKNGGALISELLPYSKSFGAYFQHRNRIIAGLTLGTLVLEADSRSGALLTANHAVEQGKDVFVIPPHDIMSGKFNGLEKLWQEGAVPVFSYLDIFRTIMRNEQVTGYIRQVMGEGKKPSLKKPPKASGKKKPEETASEIAETSDIPGKTTSATEVQNLSERQKTLFELLAKSPETADGLIEKSGLTYDDVIEDLLDMELDGIIERKMDGNYHIVG